MGESRATTADRTPVARFGSATATYPGFRVSNALRPVVVLAGLGTLLVLGLLSNTFMKSRGGSFYVWRDPTSETLSYLGSTVIMYREEYGTFPELLDELVSTKWRDGNSFLERVPSDAWDHRLRYERKGTAFAIWSDGPDGVPDTQDDVVWESSDDPRAWVHRRFAEGRR